MKRRRSAPRRSLQVPSAVALTWHSKRLEEESYETGDLGLAIGFEYGPMTLTRLGLKNDRVRCSVSRGVLESENQQKRCTGVETAIGADALKVASDAVKTLFGTQRKVKNLDFNEAAEALSDAGDQRASVIRQETYAKTPAVLAARNAKSVLTAKSDARPAAPDSCARWRV